MKLFLIQNYFFSRMNKYLAKTNLIHSLLFKNRFVYKTKMKKIKNYSAGLLFVNTQMWQKLNL